MKNAATSNGSDEGFVLIEILVALAVVGVMAALMTGFFGQLGALSSLKQEIAAKTELSAAVSHLQRTLAGVKKAPLPDDKPETNILFEGSPEDMRFAAATRQGFHSLALRDVRIFIERSDGKIRLMQTLAARRPSADATAAPPQRIVILDDVEMVSFEYSETGAAYSSKWEKDGLLPSAVRMTISRDVGGKAVSASAIARIL
jgi:general secretion pathway protein J